MYRRKEANPLSSRYGVTLGAFVTPSRRQQTDHPRIYMLTERSSKSEVFLLRPSLLEYPLLCALLWKTDQRLDAISIPPRSECSQGSESCSGQLQGRVSVSSHRWAGEKHQTFTSAFPSSVWHSNSSPLLSSSTAKMIAFSTRAAEICPHSRKRPRK